MNDHGHYARAKSISTRAGAQVVMPPAIRYFGPTFKASLFFQCLNVFRFSSISFLRFHLFFVNVCIYHPRFLNRVTNETRRRRRCRQSTRKQREPLVEVNSDCCISDCSLAHCLQSPAYLPFYQLHIFRSHCISLTQPTHLVLESKKGQNEEPTAHHHHRPRRRRMPRGPSAARLCGCLCPVHTVSWPAYQYISNEQHRE